MDGIDHVVVGGVGVVVPDISRSPIDSKRPTTQDHPDQILHGFFSLASLSHANEAVTQRNAGRSP